MVLTYMTNYRSCAIRQGLVPVRNNPRTPNFSLFLQSLKNTPTGSPQQFSIEIMTISYRKAERFFSNASEHLILGFFPKSSSRHCIALTEFLCISEMLRCVFVYLFQLLSCFCFVSSLRNRGGYGLLSKHFVCPGLIGHPPDLSNTQATGHFAEHLYIYVYF